MKIVGFGFFYLALATALGAFGTHSLKKILTTEFLTIFQTGHDYQTVAAFALIGLGLAQGLWPLTRLRKPAIVLAAGSVVFSGSLYALALSGIKVWGAVTPIGGVLMIGSLLATTWQLTRPQVQD